MLLLSAKALELARRHSVRTVLDIDYRPVLWGLTGRDDGETRFIADAGVTEAPMLDCWVDGPTASSAKVGLSVTNSGAVHVTN